MKILILFLLISTYAFAQNNTIVTDRPDQTESAETVPQNGFQIESGFVLEEADPAQNIDLFGTLFRYGLTNNVEFRFATGYALSRINDDADYRKNIGLQAGLKINFLQEKDIIPEFALLAHASLPPIGDDNEGAKTEPGFLFALSYSLPADIGIGFNAGGDFINGDDFMFKFAGAAGFSLSEQLSAFVELYGNTPKESDTNLFADTGITWLFTPHTQFDFSVGKSLDSATDSWFVGVGISHLIFNLF